MKWKNTRFPGTSNTLFITFYIYLVDQPLALRGYAQSYFSFAHLKKLNQDNNDGFYLVNFMRNFFGLEVCIPSLSPQPSPLEKGLTSLYDKYGGGGTGIFPEEKSESSV